MNKKELIEQKNEIFSQIYEELDYYFDEAKMGDKPFYIVESWSFFKNFNKCAKEVVPNIRKLLPLKNVSEYTLRNSNWTNWFEFFIGDSEWGFSDEWDYCYECNQAINIMPTCDTVDGFVYIDCWVCGDCVRHNEQLKERYIEYLQDNYRNANTILSNSDLEDLGFEEYEPRHSAGWYDHNDNVKPKTVFENIKRNDNQIIFSIDGLNMFETRWSTWIRTVA